MPDIWAELARKGDAIQWVGIALGGFVVSLAGFRLWRMFRPKLSPDEVERRRREEICAIGKIGDCEILDVEGTVILYCYSVGGIEYTAAQDVSALESLLPVDRMRMIGHASLRFDSRNPPDSIVLCERWSGLRLRPMIERPVIALPAIEQTDVERPDVEREHHPVS